MLAQEGDQLGVEVLVKGATIKAWAHSSAPHRSADGWAAVPASGQKATSAGSVLPNKSPFKQSCAFAVVDATRPE
jgi:hypothetical protein